MDYQIKQVGKFSYIEEGNGPILMMLHGLFGAMSNFTSTLEHFKDKYRVVIPLLPIFNLELVQTNIDGYVNYVEEFVAYKAFDKLILLGNSLGGHIALVYTARNPQQVANMVLTASSGLYESALGETFPQRGNYEYIKHKTEITFYNPATATKELVDEVFDIVNDRNKAIRVIYTARSALQHNMSKDLPNMSVPTLLIWGNNDTITPPFVAIEFSKLLPNSELHFIEKCGHAPMMECPDQFNKILGDYLNKFPHS